MSVASGGSPQGAGLTLNAIADVIGAPQEAPLEGAPSGFSIDSRTLRTGDLFFAIVGPNHDGHRFLSQASAAGASGLVVSDPEAAGAVQPATPVLVVEDTQRALQDLAAFVRRRCAVKVVGITGSAGKTTTKEMTRQVLDGTFRVHASRGNYNNLFGCPLSLLELSPLDQVSVLELGMSTHGELERLARIADPDIGVLTNVSGAHLANFTSLEDVADAKGELFAGMRENSIGIFNNDDDQCRRIMGTFKGYTVTFGMDRPGDLSASDYRMDGLEGSAFDVTHSHSGGTRRVTVRTRFAGVHHVYNALAAMSVGYMLGIDLETAAGRLATLAPLGMRGRVLRLANDVCILDDTYNANPAAVRFALQVFEEARPEREDGRKIVVLGDMLELGENEVSAHREIGRMLETGDADLVIGVGPLSREALDQVSGDRTRHFNDSAAAAAFVAEQARAGDLYLAKGSRGVALEKVVQALEERFQEE